jgi:hypothetical protein
MSLSTGGVFIVVFKGVQVFTQTPDKHTMYHLLLFSQGAVLTLSRRIKSIFW